MCVLWHYYRVMSHDAIVQVVFTICLTHLPYVDDMMSGVTVIHAIFIRRSAYETCTQSPTPIVQPCGCRLLHHQGPELFWPGNDTYSCPRYWFRISGFLRPRGGREISGDPVDLLAWTEAPTSSMPGTSKNGILMTNVDFRGI